MSIGELFQIKKRNFSDQLKVISRYYPKSLKFSLLDLGLGLFSFSINPYRVSRKFLQKKGMKNLYSYGETPIATLHKMVDRCNLTRDDTFLELGSGRGKGCFWISCFVGCRVIGVEWIPLFVKLAKGLSKLFFLDASFEAEDFQITDLSKATCIYLYSTSMEDESLEQMADRLSAECQEGARIITISSYLPARKNIVRKGFFPVRFPWGMTHALSLIHI